MHRRKSWNESGVSEVIGTILILGMTVVLFASIIIWVASFPTPQADVRTDMSGTLIPVYDATGNWKGVNITLTHKGGETLKGDRTQIFLQVTTSSGATKIDILSTKGTEWSVPYGINGPDRDWNTGESWSYTNTSYTKPTWVQPTDKVTIVIIDKFRSAILWNQDLQGPAGLRPPLFLEKWADRLPATPTIDLPQTGQQFSIFAKVTDPDGDLNKNSVYVFLAFLYGTPQYGPPQKMYDDGTNGDLVANDGTFSASYANFNPTDLTWDGGVVLFNATDNQGHKTTSRMTLSVIQGPVQPKKGGNPGSGRPPNLNYNGLQGFNIFNGTEWDTQGFNATDTRVFKGSEQVVVIVGSAILTDLFGRNSFTMWDPYAFQPTPVVYGSNKNVGPNTKPSSTNAFTFYQFVNGYNVWIYRFDLNNASAGSSCTANGGICFKKTPSHPPEYFFATYSVEFDLIDFEGNHFAAADAITVKDTDGSYRNYPQINFYRDSSYGSQYKTNTFNSTDNVWVAVTMFDTDANSNQVSFGTVQIRDFLGGTQIQKAFTNVESPSAFNDVNAPICPVALGSCNPGTRAISNDTSSKMYRFRLNLSRADEDPWVPGSQHYSLSIAFVHDVSSNEQYADVSAQLVIIAPLYRMDVVGGNADTQNQAWGTHDYGYYYENLNGYDKFGKTRYEFCGLGGGCKASAAVISVKFLDGDQDGDLDIAACQQIDQNTFAINYYRRQVDSSGNVVFTKFTLWSGNLACGSPTSSVAGSLIAVGDLTGDGFPEIVVGFTNGQLWYFRNDGSWTTSCGLSGTCPYVVVDSTRNAQINDVTVGDFNGDLRNDIAVARKGNSNQVTYYLNLDGRGTFSTGGTTDYWYADQESLRVGQIVTGDFRNTSASDDVREVLKEASYTEPVQIGTTLNSTFDAGPTTAWSFTKWENTAAVNGPWQSSGGNTGACVNVQMSFVNSQTVSGFWWQGFTISGSTPFSGTVNFDYKVSAYGAGSGNVKIYVFVDTTSGNPSVGTEIASYTETGTTGWKPQTGITVPSSKLPSVGTYYLKIAARTTNSASGSTTTVQFDNAKLSWQSTGGQASELLHYWRIQQLPNRASTSFSLRFEGQRSASTDGDTFVVAWAIPTDPTNPTTGTYRDVITVNSINSDTAYTYTFNATENAALKGATVWLRVRDTDHIVGNVSLDTVSADQIYIQATTQTIPPGSDISPPGSSDGTAIDADDQNGDGYWDVVMGDAGGRVYRLAGYSGGLQTPGACFWPIGCGAGTAIVGVKFANITLAKPGLEIVFALGSKVRVISGCIPNSPGCGASVVQIGSDVTTANPINALAVGDLDGNGFDDFVVGMGTTNQPVVNGLVYYQNRNQGTTWFLFNAPESNPPGSQIAIFALDVGDGAKSQYMGR